MLLGCRGACIAPWRKTVWFLDGEQARCIDMSKSSKRSWSMLLQVHLHIQSQETYARGILKYCQAILGIRLERYQGRIGRTNPNGIPRSKTRYLPVLKHGTQLSIFNYCQALLSTTHPKRSGPVQSIQLICPTRRNKKGATWATTSGEMWKNEAPSYAKKQQMQVLWSHRLRSRNKTILVFFPSTVPSDQPLFHPDNLAYQRSPIGWRYSSQHLRSQCPGSWKRLGQHVDHIKQGPSVERIGLQYIYNYVSRKVPLLRIQLTD